MKLKSLHQNIKSFINDITIKKNSPLGGWGVLLFLFSTSAFAQPMPQSTDTTKPGVRWWWMGSALDKENISWSMKQFADCGIGAVEITPIYGVLNNDKNNIEFLSPQWMEMLRFVQSEGKKNNIQIDMATGTGWPFGGPWVPMEETASRLLVSDTTIHSSQIRKFSINLPKPELIQIDDSVFVEEPDTLPGDKQLIGVYAYRQSGGKGDTFMRLNVNAKGILEPLDKKKKIAKGDWRIITLWKRMAIMNVKRAAPGGTGFVVDHFSKKAVLNYLKHISDAFDKTNTPYPHTFFNDSYEVSRADYTPEIFPEFEKRRGYRLEDNIDKLVDGDVKVVSDYRETLGELIFENFTQTWTEWAHNHGAITRNQAHGSPANLIDCYSAVDIPEIEGFGLTNFGIKGLRTDTRHTRKNDSDFSMLKYAPSAAHINGKELTSSETFTWLTEHFRTSLSQMKPDLDLMFCAGVNNVYFHGACYSPKDDPWPGWKFYASVDMSPTNSIWRDAPELMKYIDRCQTYLQWGKPDNDFLVLLPVRNMWKKDTHGERLMQFSIHKMGELAPEFAETVNNIDKAGYDCDYISEKFLLTTSYKDGKLVTAAGQPYSGLIIPSDSTIMTEAVKNHIAQLKSQGACILTGVKREDMEGCCNPEPMRNKLGLKVIRRKNEAGYHYFIANLTPNDVDSRVHLTVGFTEAMWVEPLTGNKYVAEIQGGGSVRVNLRSGQSMILQTFNEPQNLSLPSPEFQHSNAGSKQETVKLEDNWKLSFIEEAPKVNETFNIGKLRTWETLDNDSAKVTMGTGVYEITFDSPFNIEPYFARKIARPKKPKKHTSEIHSDGDYADRLYPKKWAIDLGDVRESARVYINNVYVGCAWCVPYVLTFDNSILKQKGNTLRIEVTNLPANRIADMDRRGVKWRKFDDINIVNINYKYRKYDRWKPMPSGLNGPVKIYCIDFQPYHKYYNSIIDGGMNKDDHKFVELNL